jgi:hypothetical protein
MEFFVNSGMPITLILKVVFGGYTTKHVVTGVLLGLLLIKKMICARDIPKWL